MSDAIAKMTCDFERLYAASRRETDVPWAVRRRRLEKLAQMVDENALKIAAAIRRDFGNRSADETELLEVFPTLAGIRHALKHGKAWMKTRKVATDWWFLPAANRIRPQPLGVVGIIAPWNYPLFLTTGPLIGAFAAGNRVMVKTSEFAPEFSRWLKETVPHYFGADELVVVEGGAEVAAAFSRLKFDHLLFTGSTAVGRLVMKAAAENLTPVTLELGGKSPVLVLPDADWNRTVERVMAGKLLNAGQTCIAPDYVLLPEGEAHRFAEKARAWVKKHYPNAAANPDFSHIINRKQHERLSAYLSEAAARGAECRVLADADSDGHSTYLAPHLVLNAPDDCKLMQDEIFGPILPLVTYSSLNGALDYIKARPRPLALYVFGSSEETIDYVLDNTVSGGVSVNDTIFHVAQERLPFGGVGESGMGAYHGQVGFDTFSHLKPVFRQARLNGMALLLPPYGKRFAAMMKALRRLV